MKFYFPQISVGLLKAGALLLIVLSSIFIAQSSLIVIYPELSAAITIDLLISLPLLYLFFIRKTTIPKKTVLPLLFCSAILATLILPAADRYFSEQVLFYGVPAIELISLLYVGVIVVRSRKTYILLQQSSNDVLEKLRHVLVKEIRYALFARAAAFEIAVLYFAFVGWTKGGRESYFTYHKKSGVLSIISVLLLLLIVETVVIHILIMQWSTTFSWFSTAFSTYFGLQLFAHCKAIVLRPVEINDDKIYVRCGLFGDTEIPISKIKKIDENCQAEKNGNGIITLSPFGTMTIVNVSINLKDEIYLNGFYGFQRSFSTILLSIDEPEEFVNAVKKNMKPECSNGISD